MSQRAVLIATAKVHSGSEEAFTSWQTRQTAIASKFPGFVGVDFLPPPDKKPGGTWTILMNFDSEDAISAWQRSPERAAAVAEVTPLLDGGNFGETVSTDVGQAPNTDVTEVIFSKVRPGMGDRYREWAARIQAAQAKYPGYRGMYLQPPAGGKDGHWTSILRYASAEHLEAWMNAPERKALLAETGEFIESEELMRLQTSFPGWVPMDPLTGEPPPNWKAAMLVLLGLFPIVMLEMKFLGLLLDPLGVKNASLATFIGNTISVGLTSFATMPLFVKWFEWWLFPKGNKSAQTAKGVAILCALFALEVIVLWKLI
ncbi:MAG: antibiotic biosynthesis monooxygenase [Chthoniobacterales bacterium]|nr:antibiotic biosynthesis monooxygenase [Chthoniobacterales bacterium]